ncbi:MAG: bifunctional proline dehydrogenase/L-glutamate gamma-semialdehyde dehydrogenase PutA [Betaproteobacteria bacterium]
MNFDLGTVPRDAARRAIVDAYRRPEEVCMQALLAEARLTPDQLARTQEVATRLAQTVRDARSGASGMDNLMQEFSLSSREGVALMCLAEALLRIPDTATRDRLIRDKLGKGDWGAHIAGDQSLFVNAAAWGLLLTGKLVADPSSESGLGQALGGLLRRGGEPLVRTGVGMAMRVLGKQFVSGETIDEALTGGASRERQGFRFSFDMLGEAAVTAEDAERYFAAYEAAIRSIGAASGGRGVHAGPGISLKLSALHPRYSRAQRERVMHELLPKVIALVRQARQCDIGINIDAEEADRLDLSLDILAAVAADPELAGWPGIGFVVQAYQRRALQVVDWIVDLARRHGHRLMVRLVKGAYWDSEIKRAQVDGLADYPVFTRKVHSDVCFLACAKRLLAAPDAVYPQFATHNAFTIAATSVLGEGRDYEFQCLYGMGEAVYDSVVGASGLNLPCRIYAPVGTHETLLAYLVRRLLENGSNSSFVNRIVDPAVSIAELVADPVAVADAHGGTSNPRIALPGSLFADRRNSRGFDWSDELELARIAAALEATPERRVARPRTAGDAAIDGERTPVRNPADRSDVVGEVIEADADTVERALAAAAAAARESIAPVALRARWLDAAADLLEHEQASLIALAVREAGKTLPNAVGEVREAVDFCRYYAAELRSGFRDGVERPVGPLVCISPWNFPLAIFVGQVSAAVAAGDPVLAKPAEQTPLIADLAVELFHRAGVPRNVLQSLPGRGETVGAQLTGDPRVRGVLFTGSTEVAKLIQRALAARPGDDDAVLVAETGGINAMIVDSSALPEQVVADVLVSAFDSAGQRCSALRVLCLQEEIAGRTLTLLEGAMRELRVGDPASLSTDVGPVIDEEARAGLIAHIERMRAVGYRVIGMPLPPGLERGTFVAPTLVEIPDIGVLDREVFGPVLHVLRFRREGMPDLVDAINATGYGLTHGIHSRIEETVDQIAGRVAAGNIYVNRNIVGAVVGVQPFGGEGLSGTGPKAGGPYYLRRLVEFDFDVDPTIAPTVTPLPATTVSRRAAIDDWLLEIGALSEADRTPIAAALDAYALALPPEIGVEQPGPTGERNTLTLRPRGRIACFASRLPDLVHQIALAALTGNRPHVPPETTAGALVVDLERRLGSPPTPSRDRDAFDAALVTGTAEEMHVVRRALADRPGLIVSTIAPDASGRYPIWRLFVERVVTVNTTAAGGNATLMSLGSE